MNLKHVLKKWLYVIKNLSTLDRIPEVLREKMFLKFFETAEIAKLDTAEYKKYENSLNVYRDIVNSINWCKQTCFDSRAKKY